MEIFIGASGDPAAGGGGVPGARRRPVTSVADREWNNRDVRGDTIGLQVGRVDVAVVVRIGDDGRCVVVDPVLVLVGSNGDPQHRADVVASGAPTIQVSQI